MKSLFLKSRYGIQVAFTAFFVLFSFIIRLILVILSAAKTDMSFISYLSVFGKGFIFDFGVAIFFSLLYASYLLFIPNRWLKTKFNYIVSYSVVFLMILISLFSFFAELTFWQEFESRFNFIAVDYLVYTFEVINNINESYPLPILITSMLTITLLLILTFIKLKVFSYTFNSNTTFKHRLLVSSFTFLLAFLYIAVIKNDWADKSSNRYQNELSKAGVYSFFAAFKNNELNYEQFYSLLDNQTAFNLIRHDLKEPESSFDGEPESVIRKISGKLKEQKPNVIMITIESFSADFMAHFGNTQKLTPILDSIANKGVLFTNMYATGTRTVRGMEALSLAVPPTPGNSIVRRPNNEDLSTIGNIFRSKGYETNFLYGGDGYFDNMNQYFSSNGYNIIDRGRNISVGDHYKTHRTIIPDEQVHFENAWGICDGDLYDALIKNIDANYKKGKPFYNFVMTTSNHRPYTYPAGKINIPSGTGREGAVKYTDYAIGEFLKKIGNKPWFKNTVIVFVADHCASSAGKNEIDISKYHIPCIVYNLPAQNNVNIDKMCSQIDLYPTLLHIFGWNYESNLYGENVLSEKYTPRIVLGTYQKLAYMKEDSLVILSPNKKVDTYLYKKDVNEQIAATFPKQLQEHAIAYYQTAYQLYKMGKLKVPHTHQITN